MYAHNIHSTYTFFAAYIHTIPQHTLDIYKTYIQHNIVFHSSTHTILNFSYIMYMSF